MPSRSYDPAPAEHAAGPERGRPSERASVDVGGFGWCRVLARVNDRSCQDDTAADLFPLFHAHEIGHRQRDAEVDGDAAGVEVRLDRVEGLRSAGEHRNVADRTA